MARALISSSHFFININIIDMIKCCSVEGCNNPVKYKGLCNRHYLQMKRHGCIVQTFNDYSKINIYDNYAEILITDKKNNIINKAIIDIEDVSKCEHYRWTITSAGYVVTYKNNKQILLHQLILPKKCNNTVIDHINQNKFDNRKCNLRETTYSLNTHNRNNFVNPKGIYFNNTEKLWRVEFTYKNKKYYFGRYKEKEQAEIITKYHLKRLGII